MILLHYRSLTKQRFTFTECKIQFAYENFGVKHTVGPTCSCYNEMQVALIDQCTVIMETYT